MAVDPASEGNESVGRGPPLDRQAGDRLRFDSSFAGAFSGRAKERTDVGGEDGAVRLSDLLVDADRLTTPQIREARGQAPRPATWDEALRTATDRVRAIIAEHGPDSVAFYGSGRLDTEAAYVAAKLFKGSIGTSHTDSNSRLCMTAAMAGYATSLGADGAPTCFADIERSDCLVAWGTNLAEAHPVLFDRVTARMRDDPGVELIVIDPRRTPTAARARLHVPVAPGGDISLMNAVGHLLLESGAIDEEFVGSHTDGFAAYRDFLLASDLGQWLAQAGVTETLARELADRIGRARSWLTFSCMGLNQSTVGVWKNNSLINLHLLTGQIGRPGAGPCCLSGQPNASGGREGGLLANQLPGYRLVDDPAHRAEVEAHWKRPAGTISAQPGLTAIEMFRALESGRLKAIWIAATNPAVSLPDLHQVHRALAHAELVVVQDSRLVTETSAFADIRLPAARRGEASGTITSSERLVSRSERVQDPPGEALPDWAILARFATMMGYSGFRYQAAEEVWDEFIRLTGGRPCDMAGMTSERLRSGPGLQWPCPTRDHPGTERLYTDRAFPTASGRARFLPRPARPPKEPTDHEFPMVLTTGRLAVHRHDRPQLPPPPMSTIDGIPPFVGVHPDDAAELCLVDNQMAVLTSRRGLLRLPVRLDPGLERGLIFLPIQPSDRSGGRTSANYLTIAAIGRMAQQPEFKYSAVRLAPATQPRTTPPAPAWTVRRDACPPPGIPESLSIAPPS